MKQTKKNNLYLEYKEIIFVIAVLFVALGLRIVLIHYRFAIKFDEVNYLKLAASGSLKGLSHVLHPYWSPFYPLVVALFSKILPNFELAGRMVSVLCGSLVLVPVYLFAKTYLGRRTAVYSVILLGLHPSFAFFSTRAQTEPLYTLIVTVGIFLGWFVLLNRSYFLALLLGIIFGVAYLTKPEGVGFLIVFIGVLLVLVLYSLIAKKKITQWVLLMLIVSVGFVVVASPYLFYLHKTTGEWTISAKGKANQQFEAHATGLVKTDVPNPFRSLSEDNKQVPIDQIYHIGSFLQAERQQGKPTIKISPFVIVRKYVENFYKVVAYGINHALTSLILILMIIGLFGRVWDKKRALRELYLLSYIVFFWLIVIPLFHINDRYFLPLLPLSFIWVAQGVDLSIQWFEKTFLNLLNKDEIRISVQKIAQLAVVLIVFIGLYAPELGKIIVRNPWASDYWADPVEQKIAGKWLKEHTDKTPIIMSRGHTVDFYAGNYNIAESVTIPKNELSRILTYARYRGVDYLVLNERYKESYPQLASLLEDEKVPEGLKLVYKNEIKPGLKTVIFKVEKKESYKSLN